MLLASYFKFLCLPLCHPLYFDVYKVKYMSSYTDLVVFNQAFTVKKWRNMEKEEEKKAEPSSFGHVNRWMGSIWVSPKNEISERS